MDRKLWANPEIEALDLTMTANSFKKDEAPDGSSFYNEFLGKTQENRGECNCPS